MKTFLHGFLLAVVALTLAVAAPAFAAQQTPPPGGPMKPFKVPPHEDFTLPNGMKVTLIPYGDVPKVTVDVIVRSGSINEGENQVWLSEITGNLMKEGTKALSAEQVAQQAAGMGGAISISVGADQTQIESDALSEFGPALVALLADVTRNPLLPESELPRLKKDAVRKLTISLSKPDNVAQQRYVKLIYPDHPYGRLYPTEEMLNGYSIDDVRKFYSTNFGAARTHVYVAGKFDSAAVRKAITDSFSQWPRNTEAKIDIPKSSPGHAFDFTDKPGAVQSTVYVGLPVLNPSDSDYIPFLVMNALLGGSFGSRITSNIRENKGYTYSPFSAVSAHYRDANWAESADVTTNVTGPSLKEIFFEINRLANEPPSEAELKGIQEYMSGIFVLRNSSRQGIINQLNFVELQGLGDQYLQTYVQKLNAVTPEEISAAVKKYLVPGQMKIVVVGDKEKIADQLKPYEAGNPANY
jgi:predicted Zn-dependent peptidase